MTRCFRSADKSDERLPELSTHDAVDDEVDGVPEHDEEVHEDRHVTRGPVADQRYVEGVLEDDYDQKSRQRDLNSEAQVRRQSRASLWLRSRLRIGNSPWLRKQRPGRGSAGRGADGSDVSCCPDGS